MLGIRRREFIKVLGGAAVAAPWSLAVRAQQQPLPMIAYLSGRSRNAETSFLVAFRKGLEEAGYIENRNVRMEFRFADGQVDRLSTLAAELARGKPAVLVAVGSSAAARAARDAVPKLPIVFNSGIDPVRAGLVTSFNRPGGNITGVFAVNGELVSKQIGLLHELIPKAMKVALLYTAPRPGEAILRQGRDAAAKLGFQLHIIDIGTESDLGPAFAELARERPDAIVLITGPLLITHAEQITGFVAKLGIPAIYSRRDYAAAGGLISYGDNVAESYRYTALYAARILKGEKPADLPVFQTNKLELVVNLKAARALGLTVPTVLLAIADEVIE